LLVAGGLAFSALALGSQQACAQERPSGPKRTVLGKSRGGQPIIAVQLGTGRRRVLVMGGQHGSPEGNTVTLADAILEYFTPRERDLPKNVGLDVIAVANPDGFVDGTRQYRSGVDPNRNWASGDWERDAYDSWGHLWEGLGGPFPMSEPETRALASWISKQRPALVINIHSAGGFVTTDQKGISWDLSDVYGEASGYPSYGPDRPPFGYPITGAMDGWLAGRNIPDIFVELSTLDLPEIDENLAGVSAVLQHLAG
jgi:hypothetical protein